MRNMKKYGVAFFLLFFALTALALPAPLAMLQDASDQLIEALNKNQPKLKSQPAIVNRLVRRILLPCFDVEMMSRAVVGQYRKQATKAEWEAFKNQFTRLVINTYSAPLSDFRDDKVKFFPIRGYNESQSRVRVRSIILRSNGQRIPVNYLVLRRGSDWKVADFSVEGVSMLQSYRSQFAQILSSQGFSALLKKLGGR